MYIRESGGGKMSGEMYPNGKVIVIHDTDGHGILSASIALKVLRAKDYDAVLAGQWSRSGPSTTPYGITEFLRSTITPGSLKSQDIDTMILLDIPVPVQEPSAFVQTLAEYTKMGIKVLYIDHHGHSEYHRLMLERGITPVITSTSYDLSMYLPRLYNVIDSDIEQLALLAATFDYDSSIASRISTELEEYVERLDQWIKGPAKQIEDIQWYGGHIGTEGRLAAFIAYRGPQYLLNIARSLPEIPIVPYETIGDVVLGTQLPQPGLAWKTVSKLCRVTGSKVGVVPAQSPRGYCVIVARYWRAPDEIVNIIECVVKYSIGRTVVGHPGARSIAVTSESEAFSLAREIARELARRISSAMYTPKTTHLISDTLVAQTLHEDFKVLLQKLSEILEQQQKMYEEYLELKRRQVELLERLREERVD